MSEVSFKLFFSYSHKDETLRDELAKHLTILEYQRVISSWHDRKILPGQEWDHQINDNLNTADIILLLVSSDFLFSRYCWDVEVKRAIERHDKGEACVIPVILRSVDWAGAPFARLQALPKNAKPVKSWTDQDEAFTDVARGIRAVVEELKQKRQRKREETERQRQETEALRRQREQEEAEKLKREQQAEIRRQEAERLKREQEEAEKLRQNELASEKGVDYTKLRDLLAAKKWKEADYETYLVMLQVVGRKDGDWIRSEELLNFPCTDLRTIDRLWVKYSNGHFGFSVQKEIYLSVGGKPDGQYYKEAWEKFGDRVGWRVKGNWIDYSQVTFDTFFSRGHLPLLARGGLVGLGGVKWGVLFSRIQTCKL
ncbi:serine/threonine protein kinase [Nostoc sp. CENA543]|uniref:GUN4 domain-containing protein n=1 Tax=Nostoc sp. CENA543 TaxID=1869241 RepID=UPI000CA2C172|nr:GUN4 domain-containing protein [Nostoc sp. CENA543]AUT03570.1 serine/threonine protein kinase [Nostoc sp. CENA543]